MGHRELFFNFIRELNEANVPYYFMRGFSTLPEHPDGDIDLVCGLNHWDSFNEIASKHLFKEKVHNYGFAEYCDMMLYPYFTPGKSDPSITNGRFRIDSYNSLHMNSPYNNFETKWTISKKFSDYVFDNRIKIESDAYYYIPSVECEITLLVLRDILDLKGKWKQKHINRINFLKSDCNKDDLVDHIEMVLPKASAVVDRIYENNFNPIFNLVMER